MPKTNYVVAGIGFGDEGKGRIVDYLVRHFDLDKVIRFNGGPQAAHNIVTPEGIHHQFSQFGSGMFVPGVKTFLSRFMLINPFQLEAENDVLKSKGINDALDRTFIDENCFIITPFHQLINQLRELVRGDKRMGSCGQGVGETAGDVEKYGNSLMIQVKDLSDPDRLWEKLSVILKLKLAVAKTITQNIELTSQLKQRIIDMQDINLGWLQSEYIRLGRMINVLSHRELMQKIAEGNAVFESAQGFLLHKQFGFLPHVTYSDSSFSNAMQLMQEADFSGNIKRLGVIRGYYSRHGAGPFVTYDPKLSEIIPPCHNRPTEWQGAVRLGWFDLLMARYALENMGGLDGLAVTNLDRLVDCPKIKVATAYQHFEDPDSSPLVRGYGLIQGLRQVESTQVWSVPHALSRCRPVYKTDPLWRITDESGFKPDSPYLKYLAKELNVPIVMTAFGPTAKDTICLL